MESDEFWRLVDEARAGNEDDPDAQAARLRDLLTGRSSEELQSFDRHYREQLVRAYRWDLWGAGYLLAGGMSDDAFDYFCDWLIGRGRERFERVLADPDALADFAPGNGAVDAELLRYAVQEAHEATHGGAELPWPDDLPDTGEDPAGEEWDEDDIDALARRFPRIWERVKDVT